MPRARSLVIRVPMLLALTLGLASLRPVPADAVSPDIVISQVYGGGGNAGSTYRQDFIQLYNRGAVPVTVDGWSVQYAGQTSASWNVTPLAGTIAPGEFFLVREAAGAGGTVDLPEAEVEGTIPMGAGTGKVALVANSTAALTVACPLAAPGVPAVVDFVGYGTGTNCSETAVTPTLAATTAAARIDPTTDTDRNNVDFAVGFPTPRNHTMPRNGLAAAGNANPVAVTSGASTTLTVAVMPAGSPASTTLAVKANLSAFGGPAAQPFAGGPNAFTLTTTITGAAGVYAIPVTVTDAQSRTALVTVTVLIPAPAANVVISQVYGGGGNSGATLTNDFVELYNRESVDVPVTGWTVQYASSAGTTWQTTSLTGVIPAGGYYLVQEAAGAGGTTPLPAADANGNIAMSAASGKVALVATGSPLTGACPPATAVLDFVGYGAANCSETAPAPGLSNTTADARRDSAIDTNNNLADFEEIDPAPKSTFGIPPSGVGRAVPGSVASGAAALFTVTTTAGAFPVSPIDSVTADLSEFGGAAAQPLFDDGSHGDAASGDGVYSLATVVSGDAGFRVVSVVVTDTRGRAGAATIRFAIEAAPTAIDAIQGSGSLSPSAGQFVTTRGIVTARRSSGFFIQTRDADVDADPQTSEGLFVFGSAAAAQVAVGDDVRVSGSVSEFIPSADPGSPALTEIGGGPGVAVVSSGNPLPAPAMLEPSFTRASGNFEQLERFEGMRVRATIEAISGTGAFRRDTADEEQDTATSNGEFHAVIRGVARPLREPGIDPTEEIPAGAPCCVPKFDGNPERIRVDSDAQAGAASIEIVAGQTIADLTGVLDYAFRTYTILPDPQPWTPAGRSVALPVPQPSSSEFTVGAFNMERFFDDQDDHIGEPVLTAAAFARRIGKAAMAIRDVMQSPDILGVEEVEHLSTLQRVADRLNADAAAAGLPDPQYVAYLEEGNDIGGIDSGFLVKTSRVQVQGVTQVGKNEPFTEPDGSVVLLNDRPPLVLDAAVATASGEFYPVTVIVNHLRSLSGVTGTDAARIRSKRLNQALFLAHLISGMETADPHRRIVSVGDYNAFQFNDGYVDVIGTITGDPAPADQVVLSSTDTVDANLTNLGNTLGAQQYSFLFDGNAQTLDHVLVNAPLLSRFTRMAYARNNADFPESFRDDGSRPERLSDHDMPVAYFALPGAPAITLNGAASMTVELGAAFVDPGASASDPEFGPVAVSVSGFVDTNTLGIYTLTYSASNAFGTATITRTVAVVDTQAPVLSPVSVTPADLGPPNHKMIDVAVAFTTTDLAGTPACSVAVSSNETVNGTGDGNTSVDWQVLDTHHLRLRAERAGTGTGRIYTITVRCQDGSANVATATAAVTVNK